MIKWLVISGAAFILYKMLGSSTSSTSGESTVTFEVNTPGLDANGYPVDGAGRPATVDNSVDWNTSTSSTNLSIS